MAVKTITIPKDEYDHLKRLEKVAQDELLASIERGLDDAAKGKLRKR